MKANNRYTLITGGTAGIGLELAKLFAADHHNLILVSREQKHLDDAKAQLEELGVEVVTISKDLFNKEAAFELFDEIQSMGLEVGTLVNDAGQGVYGLFKDNEIEKELAIIQLNIYSVVVLTKLFMQPMLEYGEGKILNLSSIASKIPGPWQAVYHASKAFVQSFTEALRSELSEDNITVTALLPGATDTDFFNKAGMNDSKVVQDKDKLADPAQVAKDGYDALMKGKDKVISGFKNKIQVAGADIMGEKIAADQIKKQQEPVK